MTQHLTALFRWLLRPLAAAFSGLLTPLDGVAPAKAGTKKPPIAGMPESSAQGGSFTA
ncbi:hypothetical protein [Quadrisphaera sp. KR29]|uniref:hypothetical protein n=1 Tax=Quadrisphaera sp. KR29 TaxID=3461391 RepID=UPI004043F9C9